MAHVAKYTKSQVGGMTRHYERAKKENGEYQTFGNQEIDVTKCHLNYNLAPERNQLEFIQRRTSEVQCLKRENVNVMCSWVVTAPKGLGEDEHRTFFEETYKFLNNRYANGSDRNVVSAYVHMDETTPHLHYAFIPVVWDEKKGVEKVSAKAVVHRYDLQKFHNDLEGYMAVVFGREIGILNEATKDGNKSIDELKKGTAQQELVQLQKSTSDLRSTTLKLQGEVESLENKKKGLNDELEGIQGQIKAEEEQLRNLDGKLKTKKCIEQIKERASKTLFGGSIKIPKEDFDSLIKTALASPINETVEKLKVAEERIEYLEPLAKRVKPLENRIGELTATIKNRDETIERKDLNIQGIRQVTDRDIRDLKYKIGRLEKEKLDTIQKVDRVLGKIDKVVADCFVQEWKAEEKVLERQRGLDGLSR